MTTALEEQKGLWAGATFVASVIGYLVSQVIGLFKTNGSPS